MNTNDKLVKLFLNIEKALIDFRISQIDDGVSSCNKGNCSVNSVDIEELIKPTVRDEISKVLGSSIEDVPYSTIRKKVFEIGNTSVENTVVPPTSINNDAEEAAPEIVKDSTQPVPEASKTVATIEKIVKPALSKGGTAFKQFEPINLSNVSENLEGNSVHVEKEGSVNSLKAIEAALK